MKSEIEKELENFIFLTEEQIQKLEYEERCLYREKLKNYRDWKNVIDTAREEGKKRASIEIAKNLLEYGFSIERVAKHRTIY